MHTRGELESFVECKFSEKSTLGQPREIPSRFEAFIVKIGRSIRGDKLKRGSIANIPDKKRNRNSKPIFVLHHPALNKQAIPVNNFRVRVVNDKEPEQKVMCMLCWGNKQIF